MRLPSARAAALVLVPVVLVAGYFGFSGGQEAPVATEAAPAAEVLPAITVSTVTARDLRDLVIASGLVQPVEEINVAPLVEGQQIEELLADVGDRVEAGQVLARLSRATLELQLSQLTSSLAAARANLAQAEAQLTQAESNANEAARALERTQTLKAAGNASQVTLDKANAGAVSATAQLVVARQSGEAARANLALVEAQLANIELQLSRTEVRAPFAGEISARNATLGAIASAGGAPMFVLIRDGALELRADVSDADLLRITPDQRALMHLSTEGEALSGQVRLVEPTVDRATRLGRVRITFDDVTTVRAGMFAEATIIVAERNTLAVPVTAIGNGGGESAVMLVEGGTARRQVVTTGIRDGGWVEIVSGLTPGQEIVTKAGSFVREGDRINPVPETATN